MHTRSAWLLAHLGILLALAPLPAHAADKAAAEALFRDGKTLMEAGRLDEACAKLAASVEAEVAVGSLLNLALCHEKQGNYASAWAEYRQAAEVARKHGDGRRERAAQALASKLEPAISYLVVEASQPVAGMEIWRNGEPLAEGAWGASLPVDPGEHEIVVSSPGYEPMTFSVLVGPEGDLQTLTVPPLVPLSSQELSAGGVAPLAVGGGVLVGVGLAGIVVSAVLGGIAADDVADAENREDLCPDRICTPAGRDQIDQAKAYADVSTAAFVIGGAALVAGIVMLVWPEGDADSHEVDTETTATAPVLVPLLGGSAGGVAVAGRF